MLARAVTREIRLSTADIIERRWLVDWQDSSEAQRDLVEALKARGATYCRLSYKQLSNEIIGEGWRVRPDDEGEPPV